MSGRRTLPSDELISDGVARRIGRELGFERFARTGQISAGDILISRRLRPPADCKDQHGWLADLRALRDYFFVKGPRSMVAGWGDVLEDHEGQVPWAYKQQYDDVQRRTQP